MKIKNPWVHGALFLVALIYGANYSIAKYAMPTFIAPFGFICLRVTGAFLVFYLIHKFNIKERVAPKDLIRLFFCALFGVAANMMFFFKGLSLTSPINASLIMTLTPLVVLALSAIWLKEAVNKLKIIGVALGMFGAIMQILDPFGAAKQVESINALGDLFVLVNACCYSIYLVIVKPLMAKYHPLTVVKWTFGFGLLMVWPFGFYEVVQVDWQSITWQILAALLFVIIGTTVMAYLLNAWALKFVNSSVVGVYIYFQPVLATLIALFIANYQASWINLIYALFIFSGVFLVSSKSFRKVKIPS